MKIWAIALLLAGLANGAGIDRKDVEYGRRGDKPLLLDLHVPEGAGPFAAAILVHGGGFDQGSKSSNVRPLFEPLSKARFAWFSIDYRLAPQAHFPDVMQDLEDAVRWVKANAATYHVDPTKLALIGESAGGFMVNYAGTHGAEKSGIAAVVDFYGPSDYGALAQLRADHPERFDMTTIHRHAANGGGIHFFGVEKLDDAGRAKLDAVAPIRAVHSGMPPFLVIHGTKDDQVDYEQSTRFCEAIRKAGSECTLITVEGGAHGMSRWETPEQQHWIPEMIAWLEKTLNGK